MNNVNDPKELMEKLRAVGIVPGERPPAAIALESVRCCMVESSAVQTVYVSRLSDETVSLADSD